MIVFHEVMGFLLEKNSHNLSALFSEQDRPIEKEIVHRYIEHIPVEKKYIVETKFAGEVEKSSGRRVRFSSGGALLVAFASGPYSSTPCRGFRTTST